MVILPDEESRSVLRMLQTKSSSPVYTVIADNAAAPLTFEPFGVDFFDEVGVDVSCYELGLGDDVPQHWDVVPG